MNIQERYHQLDGFRAIAAMLIVIHHAFTSNIAKAMNSLNLNFLSELFINFTQSGVELFFVLSGVVILSPYLKKNKPFEYKEYLVRRIKRIYPAYFVALLFGSLVIWINTNFPTWYSAILMKFSWPATYSQLFMFNLGITYYNLAWWSLQLELFFYLLVPLIIIAFPYFPKKMIGISLSLVIVLVMFSLLQIHLSEYFPLLYGIKIIQLNLVKIIDYPICFLIGIFIAGNEFNTKQAIGLICIGFVLVLSSPYFPPLAHSGFGLLYGGIIILSFKFNNLRSLLADRILVWLGERSYSLFLIHFSVFYLVNYLVSFITPDRNWLYGALTRSLGIPFALFLSMCLFHFVERKQARGLVTGDQFWPPLNFKKMYFKKLLTNPLK